MQILPLTQIGEVGPGDDLAALMIAALDAEGIVPAAGDVLVVTQKIVSKAEGRAVDLATILPGARAIELAAITRKHPPLIELVLRESTDVLRAVPHVLITRHRTGHVMANAGIDRSNIGPDGADLALLLPEDADVSAEALGARLSDHYGCPIAIVVSDSFGRPWRYGVVNVAIGASGLPALLDRRGLPDRDGRPLEVTQIAVGDMIATAAGLVMGEGGEGIPAAVVRGYSWSAPARPAAALVRALAEDLFR
ncbi:coenzyme F420-0:L-glutamate ligase [Sphingomonas naphthae]|uniref:Coenzyme F420-0:L-glutamate ligase n=1 Tax=Sphingomonas naphthae TaxID=1813468 RepID=A0ABY7TJU6_9SPHN|nr:coenzyme F420-0:L-glutamate ligase [Sphingomonas naphthae]WCT73503.1 coenzyme F420-0:L-glutamate ligase [Sphingomonas naphthae]